MGGTEIKFGLFDDKLTEKWSIPTNRSDSGSHILPEIAGEVHRCCLRNGISPEKLRGIGIGVPGPVHDGGEVRSCVNLGWENVRAAEVLTGYLSGFPDGRRKISMCGAPMMPMRRRFGEMWLGGGRGCRSLVMVTLGTGVGGGIVIGGKILNGSRGLCRRNRASAVSF